MITIAQLKKMMPTAGAKAEIYIDPLNFTMDHYEINTSQRAAAFLATLAHESLNLRFTEEIADGSAYEGKLELGNTQPGDGKRFKGHGLIQLTGRANHEAYAAYQGMTVEEVLEALKTPEGATDVSGWFWHVLRKLNPLADAGDFLTIQKRVNGINRRTGRPNAWEDRLERYELAKSVLATVEA
jgi:putative chitinase